MQLELKGLYRVPMTLKDGSKAVYFYAWRGGPRVTNLDGTFPAFGTTEFLAAFNRITAPPPVEDTISTLIAEFKLSTEFTGLKPKTKTDYERYLKLVESAFGSMPLEAMDDLRVRGHFKRWRDGMAEKKRTADYAWTVLARICSFGVDRGRFARNPCARGGRLYAADRNEKIWTEEHLLQLFSAASPEVTAVVMYALWTGQRQSDCIAAKWSDLQLGKVRVKQAKGGRRVLIPIGKPLADLIASLPRCGDTILTNSHGKSWTSDGIRSSFGKAVTRAGIVDDLHFHDLRGTAVTRMGLAGCTTIQIAAVTGHATKRVDDILGAHYLGGRVELAEQAIAALEARTGT